MDPRLDPENNSTKSQEIVFSTFGNIRPVQMDHFSPRNPIFEVPRARNCKNDKFVTVGVPEAETNANLILKLFSQTSALIAKTNEQTLD